MWWVLIGLLVGAIFGEVIGRSYWFWGALVGGLIGHGLAQRVSSRVSDEIEALRGEIDRLNRKLSALNESLKVGEVQPAAPISTSQPQASAIEPPPLPLPSAALEGEAPALDPLAMATPESTDRYEQVELGTSDRIAREIAQTSRESTTPTAPAKPSRSLWRLIFGENAVVRVGIVILFFGVAFLLKYAYDRVQIPIEFRLIGVAIAAIAMLAVGWTLRQRRRDFALAMQGGAVGLLYLTVFGAFRVWPLLPAGPAFVALMAIAALAAALAVMQDALVLAILGSAGGFLAPVLASTGSGNHVALFSYYALLNVGIAAVAWFKAWRSLNVLGFVFTVLIAWAWGERSYRSELFASTEPFLVFHFLLYLVIPILFARHRANKAQPYVDGTLVFGVPIVAFGMQWGLVRNTEYGLALSALALGAIYLGLGLYLWRRDRERLRMLVEAFLALGVIFGTLAIPLALSGRWTSAAWAIEGAGLVWVGLRQQHLFTRLFGVLVQFAAVGALMVGPSWVGSDWIRPEAIFREHWLSIALIALAAFFSSWQYFKNVQTIKTFERALEPILFVWGLLFWLRVGADQSRAWFPGNGALHVFLIFASLSAVLGIVIGERAKWRLPQWAAHGLPVIALFVLVLNLFGGHPFSHLGWLAWPIAFGVQYWMLHRAETNVSLMALTPKRILHAVALWLLIGVIAWELGWQVDRAVEGRAVWGVVAWILVPIGALVLLTFRGERIRWPVATHLDSYMGVGALPIALVITLWTFIVSFASDGDARPLPYVPILNPVEIVQIGALMAVLLWYHGARSRDLKPMSLLAPALVYSGVAAVGFIVFNSVLLRGVHHFAGVPYDLGDMLRANVAQATLAIAWTLLALALMFVAMRRANRPIWISGAALLGVVVVKLLLIDLSQRATVERIVAFIGVGVLMLVIGYLAPLPPKSKEARS